MRKPSPPSSSIRSASRSNCSASSSVRGSSGPGAIIGAPMQATVLVPTDNERTNIEPMMRALAGVPREGDRVLVSDYDSLDCTGDIPARLADELPFVGVV